MAPTSIARRAPTVGLAVVTLGLAGWTAAGLMDRGRAGVPVDFLAFWAAGRLNLSGADPYDPAGVRHVQLAAGYDPGEAVMMWNPPWLLAAVMPLGALRPEVGHPAWQMIQFALVGLSADQLWVAFGGPLRRRWAAWLAALGFAPTAFLVGSGQVTSLSLAGLAGFLALRRAGRPGLAGVAAALTACKPHLLALFGLALALDAVRSRAGRSALVAGGLAVLAATLAAAAPNPAVAEQYAAALTAPSSADHRAPADWRHPTPGSYLRAAVAPNSFAAQLAPLAAGVTALLVVWWRRPGWDWDRALPWLVLGSLLAAPYGAWSYDLVLLLVPVLAVAARLPAGGRAAVLALALFAGVSAALFACLVWPTRVHEATYVWVTPAVLIGYAVAQWGGRAASSRRPCDR